MKRELQFSGYLKGTTKRIVGTGLKQVDGDMVLLNGEQVLGIIEPEGLRIRGTIDREDYKVPITTQENLHNLQEKIVDTVITFCREKKLTDIDTVQFSVDSLQESIELGYWTPGTDSSLVAYGYEDGIYRRIGEVL